MKVRVTPETVALANVLAFIKTGVIPYRIERVASVPARESSTAQVAREVSVPDSEQVECDCDSHMAPEKGFHYGDCPVELAKVKDEGGGE